MSFNYNRKYLFLAGLAVLVVVTGYLQYSYRQNHPAAADGAGNSDNAVYVNQDAGVTDVALSTASGTGAFFVQARLDRESLRAKNMEELGEIRDNETVSTEIRNLAYERIMGMLDESDKEMKIEALLKEKGYADSIVIFGKDSVDVIIKGGIMSQAQATQIADIVSRQGSMDMAAIHIRSLE
ncbi:MAG TPA: hypothetical protein DD727_05025 [Clostridiales bacterium]|nr:hypothetical protein [Clostridiales bacterium]